MQRYHQLWMVLQKDAHSSVLSQTAGAWTGNCHVRGPPELCPTEPRISLYQCCWPLPLPDAADRPTRRGPSPHQHHASPSPTRTSPDQTEDADGRLENR